MHVAFAEQRRAVGSLVVNGDVSDLPALFDDRIYKMGIPDDERRAFVRDSPVGEIACPGQEQRCDNGVGDERY